MSRLSLPNRTIQQAGSTGVQPDIYTDAPQMAALSRLAGSIEGYADQKFMAAARLQDHIDSGAIDGIQNEDYDFVEGLKDSLKNVEGHKSQRELVTEQFKQRKQEAIDRLNETGVSRAAKEKALKHLDLLERNYNVGLARNQINESIEFANANKQTKAQRLYESGQIEQGDAVLEGLEDLSPLQRKVAREKSIEEASVNIYNAAAIDIQNANDKESIDGLIEFIDSNPTLLDRHKKVVRGQAISKRNSVLSEAENVVVDDALFQIQLAGGLPDLDSVEVLESASGEPLSDKALKRIARAKEVKARAISVQLSRESADIFRNAKIGVSDVMSGSVQDVETLILRGVDERFARTILAPVIEGANGDSGLGSEEYKSVIEKMDDMVENENGWLWFSKNFSKEDLDSFYKQIEDSSLSYDARLEIGARMAQAFKFDASDGKLGTAVGDYPLDDIQKDVVNRIQTRIFENIIGKDMDQAKPSDIAGASFSRSLLDPYQTHALFDEFSSPAFLNKFKGVDKQQAEAMYESEVRPRFTNAIKLSIQAQLQESLEQMRTGRFE